MEDNNYWYEIFTIMNKIIVNWCTSNGSIFLKRPKIGSAFNKGMTEWNSK